MSKSTSTSAWAKASDAKSNMSKTKQKKRKGVIMPVAPQQRKRIGVRRILIKDDDSSISILAGVERNGSFEHGINNPIIKSLLRSNPRLLGQILSTRDPLAALRSDYIMSLLVTPRGENDLPMRDKPKRKRNRTLGATATPSENESKKKKRGPEVLLSRLGCDEIKEHGTATVKIEVAGASKGGNQVGGSADVDCIEKWSMVTQDEVEFLKDVLDENCRLRRRRTESTGFTKWKEINGNAVGKESYIEEQTLAKVEPTDLVWLTEKMESEWETFEEWAGKPQCTLNGSCESEQKIEQENIIMNCDAQRYKSNEERGSNYSSRATKHRYKAEMNLTRGPRCNLGIYQTAAEAENAYDRYVIGRKMLGKMVLQEFDIRCRVKTRKAAYLEMKVRINSCPCINST